MESLPEFTAGLLRTSASSYAKAAVHELGREAGDLEAFNLPATFASPTDDVEVRLLHLAASISVDLPELFADAVCWQKVALHHRSVPADYLPATARAIRAALRRELPPQCHSIVDRHLDAADDAVADAPTEQPTMLSADAPLGTLAMYFLLAVLEGRGDDAVDLIREELTRGTTIADLHDFVLTPVLRETGRMWLMAEIPIADEHYGSSIIDRCLHLMQEALVRPAADSRRVLALGVGGNLHDFGLRMVGQRLQAGGLRVQYLGANMPHGDLAWALQDREFDLVAISMTLLMQLPSLQNMIASIRRAMVEKFGDAQARPILVGGPVFRTSEELHRRVGADAFALDAADAVAVAGELLRT